MVTAASILALASATPAGAQRQFDDSNVPTSLTGGLTATWRADPATCASHGICGFSGSTTTSLGGDGDAEISGGPGHAFLDFIDVFVERPAVVRVRRDTAEGPALCVDSVAPELFRGISPAANGRLALSLYDAVSGPLLPNARCAGPMPSDLPAAIPSLPFDRRKLGSRPVTADFSGRTPLRSGPFTGQVISTLKVRIGRARLVRERRGASSPPEPPRRRRGPRRQLVGLDYGVVGVSGALGATFAGLPGPGCAPLDACGASGSVTWSLSRISARVLITGSRRVHGDGGGLGFGLLALRQGRMRVSLQAFSDDDSESATSTGTASTRVTLPGGTVCTDSARGPAPELDGGVARSGALRITLGPVDEQGIDAVRTRCPGPLQTDMSAGGALAAGVLDPRTLGAKDIDLPLRTGGALVGPGYGGSRSGQIVLHLRLAHADQEVLGR